MKEILGAPSICLIRPQTGTAEGTQTSAIVTNAIDTRNFNTQGVGASRHVTVLVQSGLSTQKGYVYVLGHAASITDAATNATTLATITQSASTNTDTISRFEVDMIGLQPCLKLSVASGTGGTAQTLAFAASAVLSRQEQTPISSSSLATGNVVIIAAGGVTQSN